MHRKGLHMKKILLASHGFLAKGLKDTLRIFLGETDDITAVCAYIDDTDNYIKEIEMFIQQAEENGQYVICTDIYGGSVNQKVIEYLTKSNKKIPVVSGMNLPIVLSIAVSDTPCDRKYLESIFEQCNLQYVDIQNLQGVNGGSEDEFFG